MIENIVTKIEASIKLKKDICKNELILNQIARYQKKCIKSLKNGGKIIFCGNGGSFSDAQHLSAEFVSRFMFDRATLASVVLGANSSALSAIGNDYGYEEVFARELNAIGNSKDIFIPISTSGESANIIAAIKTANELGITTICLTGQSGGSVRHLCDCIRVPSNNTPRIQECHILIGHIICENVEAQFFG